MPEYMWKLQIDYGRSGQIWTCWTELAAIEECNRRMIRGIHLRTKTGNITVSPPSRFKRITIKKVKA